MLGVYKLSESVNKLKLTQVTKLLNK